MPRKKKPPKPKEGRKAKETRNTYSMQLKTKVRFWYLEEGMSLKEIKKRLLEQDKIKIADSTLSTWWSPRNLVKVKKIPVDRINATDVK